MRFLIVANYELVEVMDHFFDKFVQAGYYFCGFMIIAQMGVPQRQAPFGGDAAEVSHREVRLRPVNQTG